MSPDPATGPSLEGHPAEQAPIQPAPAREAAPPRDDAEVARIRAENEQYQRDREPLDGRAPAGAAVAPAGRGAPAAAGPAARARHREDLVREPATGPADHREQHPAAGRIPVSPGAGAAAARERHEGLRGGHVHVAPRVSGAKTISSPTSCSATRRPSDARRSPRPRSSWRAGCARRSCGRKNARANGARARKARPRLRPIAPRWRAAAAAAAPRAAHRRSRAPSPSRSLIRMRREARDNARHGARSRSA